jgi:hypothetical protein
MQFLYFYTPPYLGQARSADRPPGLTFKETDVRFPLKPLASVALAVALSIGASTMTLAQTAYLEITLHVAPANRAAAAAVYARFKAPFLDTVPGAQSKQLLIRDEDVQVLHGFASVADAQAYLASDLFTKDVVGALAPLLDAKPEISIYSAD